MRQHAHVARAFNQTIGHGARHCRTTHHQRLQGKELRAGQCFTQDMGVARHDGCKRYDDDKLVKRMTLDIFFLN